MEFPVDPVLDDILANYDLSMFEQVNDELDDIMSKMPESFDLADISSFDIDSRMETAMLSVSDDFFRALLVRTSKKEKAVSRAVVDASYVATGGDREHTIFVADHVLADHERSKRELSTWLSDIAFNKRFNDVGGYVDQPSLALPMEAPEHDPIFRHNYRVKHGVDYPLPVKTWRSW